MNTFFSITIDLKRIQASLSFLSFVSLRFFYSKPKPKPEPKT